MCRLINDLGDYQLEPTDARVKCEHCNKYFDDDYMVVKDYYICENCLNNMCKNNLEWVIEVIEETSDLSKEDILDLLKKV